MASSQNGDLWKIREDQIERHELLGSGSFGTVFRVTWNTDKGPKVAAGKYFNQVMNRNTKEAEAEIRMLSGLNHPNIIKFYGAVSGEMVRILVTEYAAGGALNDHLFVVFEQGKKLPYDLALKWTHEAALALEYLHEQKIIHRDVKSSNCVLSTGDDNQQVLKICDLGFAKEIYSTYYTSKKRGTIVYKPPEMLEYGEDGEVTDKVDVFAYGILVWEILTCETPYKGRRSDQVRNMVLENKRLDVPADCPITMKTLLKNCWMHDRNDRHDMGEVVATVQNERERYDMKVRGSLGSQRTSDGHQDVAVTTGISNNGKQDEVKESKSQDRSNARVEEMTQPPEVLPDDRNSYLVMEDWSVDMVSEKLRAVGIPDYAITLLNEGGVDGKLLKTYTPDEMREDFSKDEEEIKVGHRRSILRERDKYLATEDKQVQRSSSSTDSSTPTTSEMGALEETDNEKKLMSDQPQDSMSYKTKDQQSCEAEVDNNVHLPVITVSLPSVGIQLPSRDSSTIVDNLPTNERGPQETASTSPDAVKAQHHSNIQPQGDSAQTYAHLGARPKANLPVARKSDRDHQGETGSPAYSITQGDNACRNLPVSNEGREGIQGPEERSATPGSMKKMMGKEMQLRKLLLGAEQQRFDQSYYPVLFTNKPEANFQSSDFEFLKSIGWMAVFDFDPESYNNGHCHGFCKVRKPNLCVPDTIKDTDIELSDTVSWIFCNGRSDLEIDEYARSKWHQKRRDYVENAIKGYKELIPPERCVVIFLIQSDDNIGVLADSFSKTCSTFYGLENITCVVADDTLYEKWEKEVTGTNCCTSDQLKERSIVGLQWCDINTFMQRMANVSKTTDLFLPFGSSDRSVLLDGRTLDSWHQISVLAKNETENTDMTEEHPDFREKEREKEIEFYRGHKVEWWNFALNEKKYNNGRGYNHVCRRCKSKELQSEVEAALKGDDYIKEINIFHQAGSGGTTIGRQVLWNLHKQYRCAVVKIVSPTDTRTADEILELRMHGYHIEESSKPVLILADDLESSEVRKLCRDLEYCSRDMNIRGALCVIVCCTRTPDPKSTLDAAAKDEGESFVGITVLHKLEADEQKWFEDKYKELEGRSLENNTTTPMNLIGFMILKSECNSAYIDGIVTKAMQDLETNYSTEYELIKYAALLNQYDPAGGIPVSSCDTFFAKYEFEWSRRRRLYRGNDFKHWEHQLSSSSNLLLIRVQSYVPHCSSVLAMRVVGQNVAKAIVMYLREKKRLTLAKLVVSLLKSEIMSSSVVSRDKHLKPQVHNLLFQRQQTQDKKFSPMMENVIQEGKEMALEIFDVAYTVLNEPFCHQQAARILYLLDNNYDEARRYIDKALDDKPNNMSFLWDTKGQIFKKQIHEEFTKVYLKQNQPADVVLRNEEATRLVNLTFSAISAFRKSQEASRKEKETNLAGYIGEADVTLQMLEILQRCMEGFRAENVDAFHKYLFTDEVPPSIPMDWSQFHEKFQSLKRDVDEALYHIEGRDTFYKQYISQRTHVFRKEQKYKFDHRYQRVFGQPRNSKPPKKPTDRAEWNRRRIIEIGAGKFHDIFELIRIQVNKEENVSKLRKALQLTLENNPPNHYDLMRLICITLALSSTRDEHVQQRLLSADNLYHYATQMRNLSFSHDIFGPFFLLMFVWPHPAAPSHRIRKDKLRSYISDLMNHYKENKSKYWKDETTGASVKPATFFFLGNGGGLQQYVHIYELSATSKQLERDRFWEAPSVKDRLTQLEGNLFNKSTLLYNTPLGDRLEIKLSQPKTRVSQEKVTFYLGFSWSGPIAYNVKYVDTSTSSKLRVFSEDPKVQQELQDLLQKEHELTELEATRKGGGKLTYKEKQKLNKLPQIRSKIRKIQESGKLLEG